MALAPTAKIVFGSIAFAVFWVLAVFPALSFLPIGRTAGSLLGALLMVIFRVITPAEAYAAIDLPILGLLFGTMVVSVFLERADMFKYLGRLLSWKSRGGKDLLCRICIISAVSSALFTNDTCCVVLTEFVLKIARQNNLPPQPFLLALASSANIGSSATPIGNPQNLVIAVQSGISFGEFLLGILSAMLVGVTVNIFILLCYFWKLLSTEMDEEEAAELLAEDDVTSHRFSPATMSHLNSKSSHDQSSTSTDTIMGSSSFHKDTLRNRTSGTEKDIQSVGADSARASSDSKEVVENQGEDVRNGSQMNSPREGILLLTPHEKEDSTERWNNLLWKTCVYLVTFGMLVSLFMGFDMSWTAITAALTLIVLDFKDARPCLEKVSYSLLIFFCGMFITVDGFNKTGIPSALWDFMEPYAQVGSAAGIAILAIVILFLSNVASNVPTSKVLEMADDEKGEDASIHGADWEVVSLTASAYAASPGPKPFDPPVENKEDINKEQVFSAEMFLPNHFVFPPHKHKNLIMIEPDCSWIHDEPGSKGVNSAEDELSGIVKSDEDIWKLKSDDGLCGIEFFDEGEDLSHHGIEFGKDKALKESTMMGKEPDIYVDSTFCVFHDKTDISMSVFCNKSSDNSEPNDLSHHYMYPSYGTGASKLNEEHKFNGSRLPCEAWWKRHAMSIYNHAKGAYQFWSVFVAAAVMGFAILGQRWQREKLQLQQLKWFAISDENWSRMVGPVSRFKDMLVGSHQRNLLIRGGAASNH